MYENRFENLTFEAFETMALDPSLSPTEKVGFPKSIRDGFEKAIVREIVEKLDLSASGQLVVDLGCGCSPLTHEFAKFCALKKHALVLVDSDAMLTALALKSEGDVHFVRGRFPEVSDQLSGWRGKVNAILCYSVFQYVYSAQLARPFLDEATRLLAPGGRLLLGDLPNASKRRRFLDSAEGLEFHRRYMKTDEPPRIPPPQPDELNDDAILGLLNRYRSKGFESYLLPQGPLLPLSNRREDLLIVRR